MSEKTKTPEIISDDIKTAALGCYHNLRPEQGTTTAPFRINEGDKLSRLYYLTEPTPNKSDELTFSTNYPFAVEGLANLTFTVKQNGIYAEGWETRVNSNGTTEEFAVDSTQKLGPDQLAQLHGFLTNPNIVQDSLTPEKQESLEEFAARQQKLAHTAIEFTKA